MSIEYSEVWIGDCSRGCGRPATVRLHKEWVVCALHYLDFRRMERANDAGLAIELMKAWRAEAEFHGCGNLLVGLDRLIEDERERLEETEVDFRAFNQAERESEPNPEFRSELSVKLSEAREGDSA